MCASNEIINNNQASLELINVHINTLSMLSVLPGKYGIESRKRMKKYLDLWEEKLQLLLYYAPKREDQAIPLISYYVKNNNDKSVKSICNYMENISIYQGFCDLTLGSIYLKEGRINKGMELIRRAQSMGVLNSENIDKESAENLKKLLDKHYNK